MPGTPSEVIDELRLEFEVVAAISDSGCNKIRPAFRNRRVDSFQGSPYFWKRK